MAEQQLRRQYKFGHKEFSVKGNRPINEDRLKVIDHDWQLLLLADGMGGYINGDMAADISVSSIEAFFKSSELSIKDRIHQSCKVANDSIQQKVPGAGATLAGLCINDDSIDIFWLGDVRVYIKGKSNDFKFITKDHTLAQLMKDSRIVINPSELDRLKNTVTRGLGSNGESAFPESASLDITDDLVGVICSDGFHNQFTDEEIFKMLPEFESESFMRFVIDRVSLHSKDNASAIFFSLSLNPV
jgi:serine/threonine protein phosphatase PrpC